MFIEPWTICVALCAFIRLPIDYSAKFGPNFKLNHSWFFFLVHKFVLWLMILSSLLAVNRQQKITSPSFDLCCFSNNSLHSNEYGNMKCLLVFWTMNMNGFFSSCLYTTYSLVSMRHHCAYCRFIFLLRILFLLCLQWGCDLWTYNDFPIDYFPNGHHLLSVEECCNSFFLNKNFFFASWTEWNNSRTSVLPFKNDPIKQYDKDVNWNHLNLSLNSMFICLCSCFSRFLVVHINPRRERKNRSMCCRIYYWMHQICL